MDTANDTLLAEGARETLRRRTSVEIKAVMHRVASDPFLLNEVVAAGKYQWRITFLRGMRPLPVDENIANAIYDFFERKAGGVWAAKHFLDHVELPSIDTPEQIAKKIEESWTVTSHSSEAAKRHYGMPTGDGPIPLHEIRSLVKLTDGENN